MQNYPYSHGWKGYIVPDGIAQRIDYNNLDRLDIRSIDQALYVASVFVGQSPSREVVILTLMVGDREHYRVVDIPEGVTPLWYEAQHLGWTPRFCLYDASAHSSRDGR